jgi:hypothetical protein
VSTKALYGAELRGDNRDKACSDSRRRFRLRLREPTIGVLSALGSFATILLSCGGGRIPRARALISPACIPPCLAGPPGRLQCQATATVPHMHGGLRTRLRVSTLMTLRHGGAFGVGARGVVVSLAWKWKVQAPRGRRPWMDRHGIVVCQAITLRR